MLHELCRKSWTLFFKRPGNFTFFMYSSLQNFYQWVNWLLRRMHNNTNLGFLWLRNSRLALEVCWSHRGCPKMYSVNNMFFHSNGDQGTDYPFDWLFVYLEKEPHTYKLFQQQSFTLKMWNIRWWLIYSPHDL